MTASPEEVSLKLDLILKQTTATNGRVTRLEEEVWGHAGHQTLGLVKEVSEVKGVVYDTRAVARSLRWMLLAFAAVAGATAAVVSVFA